MRRDQGLLGHKRLATEERRRTSMKALEEAVKLVSGLDVVMEESPAGERQSNGKSGSRSCGRYKARLEQ
jgi:hypothetical protein